MTFETYHIPTIILHAELEALNKFKSIKKAAPQLGITERTLAEHMKNNNIIKNRFTKEYFIKPKMQKHA